MAKTMLIVLDTTEFHGNFRCQGAYFTSLLTHVRRTTDKLVTPQVVVDEIVNQFREATESIMPNIKKFDRMVNSTLGNSATSLLIEAEKDYRTWLNGYLTVNGCEIAPYPSAGHQEIVAKDLARKKPFQRSGKGYRDCLTWLTVIELLENGEDVAFVTENSEDFGKTNLHSDLLDDLEALRISASKITYCTSLREFQKKVIEPANLDDARIDVLALVKQELEDGSYHLDLSSWVDEQGLDYVQDEYDCSHLGIDYGDSGWIASLQSVSNLEVIAVNDIDEHSMLIEFSTELELEVHITLSYGDFFSLPEDTGSVVLESEDGAMRVSDSATMIAIFAIVYDASKDEVNGAELVEFS